MSISRVTWCAIPSLLLLPVLGSSLSAQWMKIGGPFTSYVSSIVVSPGTSAPAMPLLFAGVYGGGVLRSTDNGSSWVKVTAGLTDSNVTSLLVVGTYLYAGTYTGGVFFSGNDGATWTHQGYSGMFVKCLAQSGRYLLAGTGHGLFRSTNYGLNWNMNSSTGNVVALGVQGPRLFASELGGFISVSTDSGATWRMSDSGLTVPIVNAIFADGKDLYAGTGHVVWPGGVFISTDSGASWSARNTGLTRLNVLSFAASGGGVFAGTYGERVFLSMDRGETWKPSGFGIGDTIIYSLTVFGDDLLAGGEKRIWRRPVSEMVTHTPGSPSRGPATITLEQNYPNPFNPITTIRYGLPRRSPVSIIVYNTLGERVETLLQGIQEAGYHEARFDGSGFASGIYFYRLRVGDYAEAKKLILIR